MKPASLQTMLTTIMVGFVKCFVHPGIPLQGDLYLPMATVRSGVISGGSLPLRPFLRITTTTPGIVGQALSFDGQSAVTMGDSRASCMWLPDLCVNGLTLALWFKVRTIKSAWTFIVTNGGHSVDSYGIGAGVRLTGVVFVAVKTKTKHYERDTNTTIPTYVWCHLVLTWEETAGLTGYINGTQIFLPNAPSTDDQPSTTYNNFLFGIANNRNETMFGFHGDVDEVLFWTKMQDSDFVRNLYNLYSGQYSLPHFRILFSDQAFDKKVSAGIIATHSGVHGAKECRVLCAKNPFCFGVNWATATQMCEEFNMMDWWLDLETSPGYIVSAKQN